MFVKTGDTVMVISGKNKGKSGTVRSVRRDENRVIVEGVNMVKRHRKQRPGAQQAGIVEMEAPLNASNVMVVCPTCGPSRVGYRFREAPGVKASRRKERICKKCGEQLPESRG